MIGSLSNEFENESKEPGFQINTYHDLAMACVKESWKKGMKVLVVISLICLNLSVPIANTLYMAKALHNDFGVNISLIKSIIGLVYLTVIVVLPEPEKIKFIAIPIFIVYVTIYLSVTGHNFYLKATDFQDFYPEKDCNFGHDIERVLFDFKNFGVFLGIAMFGYEAIGT